MGGKNPSYYEFNINVLYLHINFNENKIYNACLTF